ncbi:hypothetical protein IJK16_03270 [Candidatus Saccharibacteria bacterium]|nr:hypothetical protein [Candidatus Saccharibacteria bacterium]
MSDYYVMIPGEQFDSLSGEQIVSLLETGHYSVLNAFRASSLTQGLKFLKIAFRFVIWWLFFSIGSEEKRIETAKKRLTRLINRLAPSKTLNFPSNLEGGTVLGFNHPSLGEIVRFIAIVIQRYGDQRIVFPVSLIWYEIFVQRLKRLNSLGIVITPMITNTVEERINQANYHRRSVSQTLASVKAKLNNHYLNVCKAELAAGSIVLVAPSATRQATIFTSKAAYDKEEKLAPSMSYIALALARMFKKGEIKKCLFLPVTVIPENQDFGKNLNLHQTYTFIANKSFNIEEVAATVKNSAREFDYQFLRLIADSAPDYLKYPH